MKKLYPLLFVIIFLLSCSNDEFYDKIRGDWKGVEVVQTYNMKSSTEVGALDIEIIRSSYNENFSINFSRGDVLSKRGDYFVRTMLTENGKIIESSEGIYENYNHNLFYDVSGKQLVFSENTFDDDNEDIDYIFPDSNDGERFTIVTLTDTDLVFERTINVSLPYDFSVIHGTLNEVYTFKR